MTASESLGSLETLDDVELRVDPARGIGVGPSVRGDQKPFGARARVRKGNPFPQGPASGIRIHQVDEHGTEDVPRDEEQTLGVPADRRLALLDPVHAARLALLERVAGERSRTAAAENPP